MAKKKTAKASAKAKPDQVKASEVMKMPGERVVRSVAADMASTRKSKGKLSEELAEIVAAAKKDAGIHPGALRFVESRLAKAKKTDRGLAAVATELAHLHYYCDVLGLDEMIKKQGQMFARAEAGETDEPAKQGLPFGGAVAKIAEDAGAAGADES